MKKPVMNSIQNARMNSSGHQNKKHQEIEWDVHDQTEQKYNRKTQQ